MTAFFSKGNQRQRAASILPRLEAEYERLFKQNKMSEAGRVYEQIEKLREVIQEHTPGNLNPSQNRPIR